MGHRLMWSSCLPLRAGGIRIFTMSSFSRGLRALVPTLSTLAFAADVTVVAPVEPLTTTTLEAAQAQTAQYPGGAGVIDSQDYRTGRSATWKDMFSQAAGVYVQPRHGAEESRLSIRGSGLQRTFHQRGSLVLQDGIPVNLGDGGGDFQSNDPTLTDHIVVYRGANGAALGASNLGGAIDFRSPTGRSPGATSVSAEGGSFSYLRGTATAGMANGNVDGWVGGTAWQSQGYRDHAQTQTQRVQGNVGVRLADGVENRTFLGYSRSYSELPGSLTRQQFEDDPTQAVAVFADQQRNYPLVRAANRLALEIAGHRLELAASYAWKHLDHPLWFGSAFAPSYISQQSRDGLLSARYTFTEGINRLTILAAHGTGLVHDERFLNDQGNKGAPRDDTWQRSRNSVFDIENAITVRRTTFTAGIQGSRAIRDLDDHQFSVGDVDRSENFTYVAASPRCGVLHDFGEHQAYANVSRSVEVPTFGELVSVGNSLGLLDLDPQKATTAEIGSRGHQEGMSWDVSAYYAWITDELISYQVAPNVSRTINAERTRHGGLEAAGDTLAAGWLRVRANYLFSWFRFQEDDQFGNNTIAGLPEHHLALETLFEKDGFYAGPTVEYNARAYVDHANTTEAPAWILAGAKAGYRVRPGLSAWVEAKNLLDQQHIATFSPVTTASASSAIYNPGDGRSFYAGAGWSW